MFVKGSISPSYSSSSFQFTGLHPNERKLHTVYVVHLTVILIWQFGKFVFIHQIKCTHCLYLAVSIHDLDSPCH